MKPSIQIHLDNSLSNINNELIYILTQLLKNYKAEYMFLLQKSENCIWVSEQESDISFNQSNFENPTKLMFSSNFTPNGYLILENGTPDYLATAFYLITCTQELDTSKKDKFGRFPYADSYQKHFGISTENRVQKCFDEIVKLTPKLGFLKKPNERSKIFLSHDVDFINGALMQDGFYALKKMNIPAIFQIMFSNLLVKPQWLNMDKIMKIESEYEFKSTFYWLVNKGLSKEGIKNSDYIYNRANVQEQLQLVKSNGWENGLHKSISDETFEMELAKLNFKPTGNRYHFLKFRPHADFEKINNAGLKFDTSLGFAEEIGFRNSYGLPFKPYNFKTKKEYDFVECPLHIMDTTLHHYQKKSADEAFNNITSFTQQNAENAVLSVLWHNNYFTPYKYGSYFKLYKQLLSYFYENKFTGITQQEIIEKYS